MITQPVPDDDPKMPRPSDTRATSESLTAGSILAGSVVVEFALTRPYVAAEKDGLVVPLEKNSVYSVAFEEACKEVWLWPRL